MVLQDQPPAQPEARSSVAPTTVAIQCVASMAGTLIGEALGSTLPAKLVVGCLGALIGAFLTAPGRNRRRRIVAVAILIALIHLFRRAGDAFAAERRGWVPANWAVVGACAAVGFAGGSAVTTIRGGWDTTSAVSVPQVRGETRAAALGILEDAGLAAATATEPSESIPAQAATRTDPPGGATVDDGARVTLFISTGPPDTTLKLPDVTGSERDAARRILRDAGVRPRVREESSETIAAGHATRTIPPAGTTVDRDARVTLLISTGAATQTIEVPGVSGQSRADAYATLENVGLKPQGATEPSDSVAEGSATRTDPVAGTVVDEGSAVTVFISSGPPPLLVPDVVGLGVGDAQKTVEAAGLKWATKYVESSDVPDGDVIDSNPDGGQEIEPGATVELIVSCGSPCVE